FENEVRNLLAKGDPNNRAAAASLVGETAAIARDRGVQSAVVQTALARLVPDLVQLTRDPDPRMRGLAVRSLGKIQAEPGTIVPAIDQVLRTDSVLLRRYAAEALGSLIRILPQAARKSRTEGVGLPDLRPKMIAMAQRVVPAAGHGLADSDV